MPTGKRRKDKNDETYVTPQERERVVTDIAEKSVEELNELYIARKYVLYDPMLIHSSSH